MQTQSSRIQRRLPIVGEGTTHSQAVSANDFGLFIVALLQCSFDGTNPTHLFFEFFLGMPISFSHRFRRLAEVMEVTQLMWDVRQSMSNGLTNGVLPIGDDSFDRNLQCLANRCYFFEQRYEILFR